MKCLLVLSHLMTKECILSTESIARAELAIDLFKNDNFRFLITTGWAYRPDCDTPISEAFKDYILKNSIIKSDQIISSPYSRDTVGDAFFSLQLVNLYKIRKLVVVTSDYHLTRTRKIFKSFFKAAAKVEVIGIKTDARKNQEVLDHELKSLNVFESTFSAVNFENIREIYECISTQHPFYNGDVFSKIAFE